MFIIPCLFTEGSGFVNAYEIECSEQILRQRHLLNTCQIKHKSRNAKWRYVLDNIKIF
jgi:hypothetical protein